MVDNDKAELARLRREVATLRGELATFRSALALGPDETIESVAGRIRRQLDRASSTSDQAMLNVQNLYQSAVLVSSVAAQQASDKITASATAAALEARIRVLEARPAPVTPPGTSA